MISPGENPSNIRLHGQKKNGIMFLRVVYIHGIFLKRVLFFCSDPTRGGIVAEYGEDDSDPEEDLNDKFTDLSIMACLLCKRQFPNKEALERHQKLSDLHKVIN